MMKRSTFIKKSLLTGATMMSGIDNPLVAQVANAKKEKPFTMKFSPDFGIFKEQVPKKVVDQIKWGYDQGFRAWENTFLTRRPVEEQEQISKIIHQLGMEFGQFVGTMNFKQPTFASRDQSIRDNVLAEVRASVEIAKRMNTKFVHNVLGMADSKVPWDFQMANAVELLKRVAAIYEAEDIIMVMESMNHKIDHPGMFLHSIPQAYAMSKAVDSPALKILFDFYHVQIQEGNIIPTLDYAWDEIAYLQVADTPGRNEPTTGEINYVNVLQHVHNKGYRGFVGLEHSISKPGKEGVESAIAAYRSIDPKEI